MSELYVFGDEAGTLVFSPKDKSKYFILTTISVPDCSIGDGLLQLRRQLAWEGVDSHVEFRASEERQVVRDRVFELLNQFDVRVDATVFEKRKVRPDIRRFTTYFYKFAWFYHLRYLLPQVHRPDTRLLVVAASIGERKKKQEIFAKAVRDVVSQLARFKEFRCAFWMARTDPCLWATDYCSWAIQRKWEHEWQGQPDDRSHRLISERIQSEFDIFRFSQTTYY
jgi:hypothetical protein